MTSNADYAGTPCWICGRRHPAYTEYHGGCPSTHEGVFCQRCQGSGSYPLPANEPGPRWFETAPCRRCGGTGLAHNGSKEAPM